MNFYQAVVLGIVEGLTEFLPVSSTFHLIFTSQFLGLEQTEFVKFFEVFIQAGAISAVLWLYGRELLGNRQLVGKIALSFIPTVLVGLLMYPVIKDVFFESQLLMIGALMVVGLIFIVAEWGVARRRAPSQTLEQLSNWQAVLIGVAQGLSILPGVSRAGAVILCMILLGSKRAEAAKYSFLLAVPTIGGAAAYDLLQLSSGGAPLSFYHWQLIGVGLITAFIAALLVLKWFIRFLQRHTLVPFGLYRLALGLILLKLVGV